MSCNNGELNKLILKDHQLNHVDKLLSIFEKSAGAIDSSPTGSGKTFSTLFIAKELKLKLLVVCPPIVQSNWKNNCTLYGIECVDVLSYQALRSVKNHQPKHEYLIRNDDTERKGSMFKIDQKFEDLINEGIFLVFDEAQNLKNNCDQFKACKELCKSIAQINVDANFDSKTKKLSKFCLLSGSLFDKKRHVFQFLEIFGLLPFIGDRKKITFNELLPFFKHCMVIDKTKTKLFFENNGEKQTELSSEELILTVYELFIEIIRPKICSSMPPPKELFLKTMRSGFFNMLEGDGKNLSDEVNKLCKNLGYNSDLDEIQNKQGFGNVVKALEEIERIKKPIFIENAKKVLNSNPKSKVIICLNYRKNIMSVASSLQKYNPMVIMGGMPMIKKDTYKYLFQTNDDYRLIIMTTCISVGINLHDTTGERPRTMFISPLHSVLHIHQAANRIIRCDTASEVTVYLVYGKAALKETSIINALCRKTCVLKELHEEQAKNGVLFPADYDKFFEKDL